MNRNLIKLKKSFNLFKLFLFVFFFNNKLFLKKNFYINSIIIILIIENHLNKSSKNFVKLSKKPPSCASSTSSGL